MSCRVTAILIGFEDDNQTNAFVYILFPSALLDDELMRRQNSVYILYLGMHLNL